MTAHFFSRGLAITKVVENLAVSDPKVIVNVLMKIKPVSVAFQYDGMIGIIDRDKAQIALSSIDVIIRQVAGKGRYYWRTEEGIGLSSDYYITRNEAISDGIQTHYEKLVSQGWQP
jgi:hypothetical protein